MDFQNVKALIKQNLIFYLTGFLIVFILKLFYSKAGSDQLLWILTPTAWWVKILNGIPFDYQTGVGFVNHSYRFIIAPSCSGVQFMMISIAMLIFSFVHRMGTKKKGVGWIGLSVMVSYLFTILVNGVRIILAIYLPLYIEGIQITSFLNNWMTPERLHTVIGIVVYFTSLIGIYCMAEFVSLKCAGVRKGEQNCINGNDFDIGAGKVSVEVYKEILGDLLVQKTGKYITPGFWYFSIVLGIPFLNRAYRHDGEKFMEYGLLLISVCLVIMGLIFLITMIFKFFVRRKGRF
jgi:exosortase K